MPPTYRIRNWKKHFEKAQSRAYKTINWVALPNKHDGKGFRRVMRMKNGPEIYCGWILIVQVASKCPERGLLVDEDGPLTAIDLEDKTGCSRKVFEKSLEVLCSKEIAWIEKDVTDSTLSADYEQPVSALTLHNIHNIHNSSIESEDSQQQEAVLVFPCTGDGPENWNLIQAKVDEFTGSFPGIDVMAQCRAARQWCISNPTRRKTHKGMERFVVGWLTKAQNSAPAISKPKKQQVAGPEDMAKYCGTGKPDE